MQLSLQQTCRQDDEQEGVFQDGKEQFEVYSFSEHRQTLSFSKQLPSEKPKLSLKISGEQPNPILRSRPRRRTSIDLEAPAFHFSKNFQSGNLESAKLADDGTYRLRISNDCNSRRQSQWFYFSCRGIRRATFVLNGFIKPDSLYNYGMKVCVQENGHWIRGGQNISYEADEEEGGYRLKFTFKFRFPSSKTYFAYCFPYTYNDVQNHLQEIQRRKLVFCRAESIGKTLLKNDLQCITIAEGKGSMVQRELIIVTARVHPGETVSSYIMQGFLNQLLGDSQQAQLLRQQYIFKIVPMLNPDGVSLGNYRLSYAGSDLNRKWKDTSPKLHPEVYMLKKLIQKLSKQHRIRLMIDMHGHSRKKGVFFYGCQDRTVNTREFPYIMSQVHPSYHYPSCCFAMPKSKEGTLRLAMNNYLKLPFIYTLQSSFCGDEGTNDNYTIADLTRIGAKLVEGMCTYLSSEMAVRRKEESLPGTLLLAEVLARRQKLVSTLANSTELMQVGNEDDSGSQSAPSEGCYREEEIYRLIKIDPFLPAGNSDSITSPQKQRIADAETMHRPSTTQKKPLAKPTAEQTISPDCKVRLINGELFDRLNRSKTLKQTDSNAQKSDSQRVPPSVVIIQEGRDVRLLSLGASKKHLNHTPQYKRVKYYVSEQLGHPNSRKRVTFDRQRDLSHQSPAELETPSAVFNSGFFRQRKINTTAKINQQPRLLRINEAKMHMNIFTPSFVNQHSATISYESQRRSSLSGFNRSIRAKDYIEEKRKPRLQPSLNRKGQFRDPLPFEA